MSSSRKTVISVALTLLVMVLAIGAAVCAVYFVVRGPWWMALLFGGLMVSALRAWAERVEPDELEDDE